MVEDGGESCLAKCYWCSADVSVPLAIREGVSVERETFLLRK